MWIHSSFILFHKGGKWKNYMVHDFKKENKKSVRLPSTITKLDEGYFSWRADGLDSSFEGDCLTDMVSSKVGDESLGHESRGKEIKKIIFSCIWIKYLYSFVVSTKEKCPTRCQCLRGFFCISDFGLYSRFVEIVKVLCFEIVCRFI